MRKQVSLSDHFQQVDWRAVWFSDFFMRHKHCNGSCLEGEYVKVMASVIITSKSALCVGHSRPARYVRGCGPCWLSLLPTIKPWMKSISSLEGPCGFCHKANEHVNISTILSANQHWHSHSLSMPLSVTPHLRFDGRLIELQIWLEQGRSHLALEEVAFLQSVNPLLHNLINIISFPQVGCILNNVSNTRVKMIACVT